MGAGLMSRRDVLVALLAVAAALVVATSSSVAEAGPAASGGLDLAWISGGDGGLVADNIADEFAMDSEVGRRILQARGYISYGALARDRVPCSLRGASYYNCRPGAQANPYTRGCSAITRCRTS